MKRQIRQHNPIDPSPIRYSFPRGRRNTRRPETLTIPTGSQENQGITRKKSVRFEGVDKEKPPEASRDNDDTAPKTSEYAFFKRLKGGTGKIIGSGSMRRGVVNGLKLSEPADSSKGRRTDTAVDKNFRSSPKPADSSIDQKKAGSIMNDIHSEWEQMILHSNSPTPNGDLGKHVDIFSEKRQKLCQWVAENSYPDFTDLRSQGCDCISMLLKRLFPETNEDKVLNRGKRETDTERGLHAEPESDIYFWNLHRKPVRNELQLEYVPSQGVGSRSFFPYSHDLAMNRGQQGTDCKTPLLSETGSDIYFRNYMQLEDGPSPNVGSPSYFSFCHDLVLDRVQSGTGTKAALLTEPQSEIYFSNFYQMPIRNSRELEYRPESGPLSDGLLSSFLPRLEFVTKATPVSSTICDSTSDFISEEPGLASTYFKEIKECCYFDGLSSDRQSYAVLEEDINFMSNERKESPNCLTTELSLYPISASSRGDDQCQNLNGSSLSRLLTQSLISYVPPELPLAWCTQAASNIEHSSEKHFLEVKDDIFSSLDKFSPLSFKANHVNFDKYSSCHYRSKGSGLFHSPKRGRWLIDKVLDEEHPRSGSETLYSFGHHCNLEEKWLPQRIGSFGYLAVDIPQKMEISSPLSSFDDNATCLGSFNYMGNVHQFGEDIIKIRDWSSFYFRISSNKHKASPLLLDGSCRYQSEQEMYPKNSEGMYS